MKNFENPKAPPLIKVRGVGSSYMPVLKFYDINTTPTSKMKYIIYNLHMNNLQNRRKQQKNSG